jgi:hypothetical protein
MRLVVGRVAFALSLGLAFGTVACSGESTDDDGDGSGSSSGVPSTKFLDELTAEERLELCRWINEKEGGPGERQCENETITVQTPEECATNADFDMHCSVALVEACGNSLNGDACRVYTTPECASYIECAAS